MKSRITGFTLIEMVIVVAIIGILAAIAYPSYQDSVRKARRADLKAVLIEASQWMERFYTDNLRYDQNRAGTAVTAAGQFPGSGLTVSPKDGGVFYNISLQAVNQSSYTLQAVPTNAQSGDPCGNFTLTNAGVRNVTGSKPVAECWR
ncbi:MAG TPA: type IV pilin protein [Candidatus Competibacter sp.]|nr:type IV pilin protein [Candidatus Competibacter sp.]HUM94999.1 type IV pilin protein [Candidatus Competibacter sp.]